MKSGIDWNEIIPLLPRTMRDNLYLEAVSMLSQQDEEKHPAPRHPSGKKIDPSVRKWRSFGVEGRLVQAGRTYKINKDIKRRIEGEYGNLWNLLKGCKNDSISLEGIATLAVGNNITQYANAIWYLWSRGFLEVLK